MYKLNQIGIDFHHDSTFIIDREHGSKDYLFIYLKSDAEFFLDNKWQKVKSGACILYEPNTKQLYRSIEDDYVNDYIHFVLDDKTYFDKLNIPTNKVIYPYKVDFINTQLKSIEEESLRCDLLYDECIDLKIKYLFINISRNINSTNSHNQISSSITESLRCLRVQMLNNITEEWKIEDMAKHTNLSPSYFQFAYKVIFNISPKKDLILKRIEHAKIYLKQTQLSVDRISNMLGYSNQYHFIRQFKKCVNTTPLKYRNRR